MPLERDCRSIRPCFSPRTVVAAVASFSVSVVATATAGVLAGSDGRTHNVLRGALGSGCLVREDENCAAGSREARVCTR